MTTTPDGGTPRETRPARRIVEYRSVSWFSSIRADKPVVVDADLADCDIRDAGRVDNSAAATDHKEVVIDVPGRPVDPAATAGNQFPERSRVEVTGLGEVDGPIRGLPLHRHLGKS